MTEPAAHLSEKPAGIDPAGMPAAQLRLSISAEQPSVRAALAEVTALLSGLAVAAEARALVELVLAEALNNIIEHAFACATVVSPIRLCLTLCQEGLHVTLVDEGQAMPRGRLPAGRAPLLDGVTANLPEGGFGWFLIRGLTQDLSYIRAGSENHLRFCMQQARPGQA